MNKKTQANKFLEDDERKRSVRLNADALSEDQLRYELKVALKKNQQNDLKIKELKEKYNSVLSSRSWRITYPIRLLSKYFGNTLKLIKYLCAFIKKHGFFSTILKVCSVYRRGGLRNLKNLIASSAALDNSTVKYSDGHNRNDYEYWVKKYATYTVDDLLALQKASEDFVKQPLISIVMPVYNANPIWLSEAIQSVVNQTYQNWQLCIADDCSTDSAIAEVLNDWQKKDERINVVFRKQNGHISEASNSALSIAKGEWIALLDHDDVLPAYALHYVVQAINDNPNGQLFYSDEDKISEKGDLCDPYFKSDWNRTLYYSQNMICHLGVYSKNIIDSIEGFRVGFEGSQDYDLALRYIEKISDTQIIHIPRVLYHWRVHKGSVASSVTDAKPYAVLAGQRALEEHFERMEINAEIEITSNNYYRVHYTLPVDQPLVSIIIPTKNRQDLVKQCIDSIEEKTTYKPYEIILVDNGSDDPEAVQYFSELKKKDHITVIHDDAPFNYSALNNRAVVLAKGDVVCFLNNDIEVISDNWLTEMVSRALQPGVGAVGAKLYYPNDTIQHAGVVIGIGGVAGHLLKRNDRNSNGYFNWLNLDREYLAITAACLVVKKSTFLEVGGFNEDNLAIAFNDVDLCLKIYSAGYRNIYTPYAELYHHESISRGAENTVEKIARFHLESEYMEQTWSHFIRHDPAYNPNLTLTLEDCSLKWQ